MNVIIMRGLPGSGKSTWIKQVFRNFQHGTVSPQAYYLKEEETKIFSADSYHMVGDEYRYDPARAGEAHASCLREYLSALMLLTNQTAADSLNNGSAQTLIVDNTNTTVWQIAPYYAAALAFNVDVRILRVDCSFEKACKRNIHKVPASTIWQMHQNIMTERLPSIWKEDVVFEEVK